MTSPTPNVIHEMNLQLEDVWSCKDGQSHPWLYRRDTQEYFCPRCKAKIGKRELKKATDLV